MYYLKDNTLTLHDIIKYHVHTDTHTDKQTEYNKAIRDGKYLARHMPVLGNVHPIKIESFDIFRDVISLLAQVVILLIEKYLKEIVSPVFEIRH